MKVVTIFDKEYKFPMNWGEIPISQGITLLKIVSAFPKKLLDTYAGKESEEPTDEEFLKVFPLHYGRVIELLGNVPNDEVKQLNPIERVAFYKEYLLTFVIEVLTMPETLNINMTKFNHENVIYHFPYSGQTISGDELPMINTTAIEFTETSDLMIAAKKVEGGDYDYATNIIAILCRPTGEAYDEQTCFKRAKTFQTLPMTVLFQVFFCLQKRIITSLIREQISLANLQGMENYRKQTICVASAGTHPSMRSPKRAFSEISKKLRRRICGIFSPAFQSKGLTRHN